MLRGGRRGDRTERANCAKITKTQSARTGINIAIADAVMPCLRARRAAHPRWMKARAATPAQLYPRPRYSGGEGKGEGVFSHSNGASFTSAYTEASGPS